MTKLVFPDLAGIGPHFTVLELIPDTHAWVKDRRGHFVYGNRLFYERFGITSMEGLLGKTDYDLAPEDMARRYREDDDQVLEGGVVTDRLELIRGQGDAVEWFLTSKWPVHTPAGDIIGSFGISRHLTRTEHKATPLRELSAPIDYIAEHFASDISVQSLARACNISVSALERRFRKHLQVTPRQYINEVRLEHATRMLEASDKAIGTIALETGFADHSHFTRAFTRRYGMPPSQVRSETRLTRPLGALHST